MHLAEAQGLGVLLKLHTVSFGVFSRSPAMSLPEPSTSQIVCAPSEVLLRILKNLDEKDVRNASATCFALQSVVAAHMSHLTRSSIYDLTLQCREEPEQPVTLGKFRFPLRKQITKRKVSLLLRNKKKKQWIREGAGPETSGRDVDDLLDETLKKFVIDGAVNFDRFTVDEKLCAKLTESFVDFRNARLTFTLCNFQISPAQLMDLFKCSSQRSLSIEFCENVDKLLSDELFLCTDALEHVNIQLRDKHTRLELSDKVLEHWASQKQLPTRIFLNQTKTNFTLSGVVKLIKALQFRSARATVTQAYSWDLGNVIASEIQQLFIPGIASTSP
uniref:F-box domain-containing protein n=1 Tax=Steinernema glaseri TaxID=37863 RepID=A0A1I7ZRR3_9BILA